MTFRYYWILGIVLFVFIGATASQIIDDTLNIKAIRQETSLLEIHAGNHAKIIRFCVSGKEYAYLIEVKDFNFAWYGGIAKSVIDVVILVISGLTAIVIFQRRFFKKQQPHNKKRRG